MYLFKNGGGVPKFFFHKLLGVEGEVRSCVHVKLATYVSASVFAVFYMYLHNVGPYRADQTWANNANLWIQKHQRKLRVVNVKWPQKVFNSLRTNGLIYPVIVTVKVNLTDLFTFIFAGRNDASVIKGRWCTTQVNGCRYTGLRGCSRQQQLVRNFNWILTKIIRSHLTSIRCPFLVKSDLLTSFLEDRLIGNPDSKALAKRTAITT